jgi:hypothetical protein
MPQRQILTPLVVARAQELLEVAADTAMDDSATSKRANKTGREGKDLRAPREGAASIRFASTDSKISSKPSLPRRNPSHPEASKPRLAKLRPPTPSF